MSLHQKLTTGRLVGTLQHTALLLRGWLEGPSLTVALAALEGFSLKLWPLNVLSS